jgi:hypothetical protein
MYSKCRYCYIFKKVNIHQFHEKNGTVHFKLWRVPFFLEEFIGIAATPNSKALSVDLPRM